MTAELAKQADPNMFLIIMIGVVATLAGRLGKTYLIGGGGTADVFEQTLEQIHN